MEYQGRNPGVPFSVQEGGVPGRGRNNKIQENAGKSSFFLDFSEKWLIVL
jgi:hypothetical protein